jgi:hypothetical protein
MTIVFISVSALCVATIIFSIGRLCGYDAAIRSRDEIDARHDARMLEIIRGAYSHNSRVIH